MILPDLRLYSRANQHWQFSGLDSLENCVNKQHFQSYQHPIEYRYNSRGFRDAEWPNDIDQLKHAVWCVGDSFTVGLGSPLSHTWVNILQHRLNKRCINVSMDGASNYWIARKISSVLDKIKPEIIIIHWSFFTRYELIDQDLDDEKRRLNFHDLELTSLQLLCNFNKLVQTIEQTKQNTKIIHSFIPGWAVGTTVQDEWDKLRGPDWPKYPASQLEMFVQKELQTFGYAGFFELYSELLSNRLYVPEFTKLDLARDGFHYDKLTAAKFVDQLENLVLNLDCT
jgi:hypothetical protein